MSSSILGNLTFQCYISKTFHFLCFFITQKNSSCLNMATNVRKTLLSVQIFICVLDLTKGRFQNFMPMKSARKYVFFSDISLTHSFFKANLICNACNGYLVSQNVSCSSHPEAKFFTCPDANFVQGAIPKNNFPR